MSDLPPSPLLRLPTNALPLWPVSHTALCSWGMTILKAETTLPFRVSLKAGWEGGWGLRLYYIYIFKSFYMFCHTNHYFILSTLHTAVHSHWNECPFTILRFGNCSSSSELCSGITFLSKILLCLFRSRISQLSSPYLVTATAHFNLSQQGIHVICLLHSSPQAARWLDPMIFRAETGSL